VFAHQKSDLPRKVALMGNAKAQHRLVGVLVNRYPDLVLRLAELAGVKFPDHDGVVAAPNNHQMRGRGEIETDATVRMLRGDRAGRFAQVEMQRDYSWDKLTTLRAYYGSEVRNSRCGGHMFVLSPRASVASSFQANDERHRETLDYQASYLSGQHLEPLADAGRSFQERALAAAMTDFEHQIPASALAVLSEMFDHGDDLAELLLQAMLEECADHTKLEEAMAFSPLAMERLRSLPTFQAWESKVRATATAEGRELGFEQGREQGRELGREQGLEQGIERGLGAALVSYFTAKDDVPSRDALADIDSCTDQALLRNWLLRAYNGETAAEIFAPATAQADSPASPS
jgi:hypothetical protein